jgi:DNA-directed RNA polymerase specialized sigma24 family protein
MATAGRNSEESSVVARLALRQAMNRLSPSQRDAYLWCEIRGFTQEEAATILQRAQQTVAENLSSARSSIKKLLS